MLTVLTFIVTLQEFSEKEYSAENIHFWMDCQKLRGLTNPRDVRKQVKHMYAAYFAHTAPQPINVDSQGRTAADKDLLDPSNQAFKIAECQVYSLMRDDSYARFLRSEQFASHVKDDISEAGGSTSSVTQTPSAHKPLSASSSLKQQTTSQQQQEGKDVHGLVSWYKTSLRPKLLRSSKKRPKSLNFDGIPPPVPDDLPDSDTGAPSPTSIAMRSTSTSRSQKSQGSSSGSHSDTGTTHSHPIESTTSLKKIDVIPEEVTSIPTKPSTSSCPSSSSHERHHHHKESLHSHRHHHVTPTKKKMTGPTASGRDSLDRFAVSPICFNLNSDRDYEEFFDGVLRSCLDRQPTELGTHSPLLKDVSDLKFTSLFHSQPCLPDITSSSDAATKIGCKDDQTIDVVMKERTKESDEDDLLMLKTCISLSPSLHDIYDQLHRPRHRHHHSQFHHHHRHIYSLPPPIPPKGGRLAMPLPPPVKGTNVRRNLSSYEALYV